MFTTIFAPFSKIDDGIPPMLWLIVARAGGFLSIAMAYRLASRLAGDEKWIKVTAGVVAAAVMCITPRWGLLIAQGFTEPLAAGLLLWAIERHLDGHRGHAFFLGFLVALNRPEFWPFLARLRRLHVAEGARAPRAGGRLPGAAARACGSCPSGSARATRSAPASRPAASRPGASRARTTRGWQRCTEAPG